MVSVTQAQVNEILRKSKIKCETINADSHPATMVSCLLPNGFTLVEVSGAVDSHNYNEEIGRDICMRKIESEIWRLEGYALANKVLENDYTEVCDNENCDDDCDDDSVIGLSFEEALMLALLS